MKFVRLADTLHPADDEAIEWLMSAQEGDELELAAGDRTSQQNRAMWQYCSMLAKALGDAGMDQRTYPFKDGLSIPFSKDSVMEIFWRPVQKALLDKTSTRDLTTKEVNQIYEALDKAMSERVGVHVEFPSREGSFSGGRTA